MGKKIFIYCLAAIVFIVSAGMCAFGIYIISDSDYDALGTMMIVAGAICAVLGLIFLFFHERLINSKWFRKIFLPEAPIIDAPAQTKEEKTVGSDSAEAKNKRKLAIFYNFLLDILLLAAFSWGYSNEVINSSLFTIAIVILAISMIGGILIYIKNR